MADSKITALTALTAADPVNDMFPVVDVSDTSMAASGTTKKISVNNILGASGTATLASATITGALGAAGLNVTGSTIPANGVYLGSANNLSFSAASALGMALNSTGLGVGGSPSARIHAIDSGGVCAAFSRTALPAAGLAAMYIQAPVSSGFSNTPLLTFWYQNTGISNPASECFAIRTNSTDRLYIDAAGNCGIGVTPSAWATLRGLQNGRANLVGYVSNSEGAWLTNNAFYDGSWKYQTSAQASHYQQLSGAHSWSIAGTGTAGNAITFTQAMTLDASGNLLVGTTTAGAKITALAGASGQAAIFQQPAQNFWCVLAHNQATSGDNSFVLFGTEASFTSRGSITYNRAAGQVSYNITSDYRLKEDVKPLTGALNRISSLKPSTYKFKETGFTCEGFIAHELAEVIPAAVTGEKDAVNEDGSIKAQGVDLSKVVPVLVAAIKELAAEVNALKNA